MGVELSVEVPFEQTLLLVWRESQVNALQSRLKQFRRAQMRIGDPDDYEFATVIFGDMPQLDVQLFNAVALPENNAKLPVELGNSAFFCEQYEGQGRFRWQAHNMAAELRMPLSLARHFVQQTEAFSGYEFSFQKTSAGGEVSYFPFLWPVGEEVHLRIWLRKSWKRMIAQLAK